jgi:hypothetical protein
VTLAGLLDLTRDVRRALGLSAVDRVLLVVRAHRLREAFARYARHDPTCCVFEFAPGPCDCGFAQARAELLGADDARRA